MPNEFLLIETLSFGQKCPINNKATIFQVFSTKIRISEAVSKSDNIMNLFNKTWLIIISIFQALKNNFSEK